MKPSIIGINHVHVCIPSGQEDKAREFYGNILGFTEIEKPEALKPNCGLWFEISGIQFHIGIDKNVPNSRQHCGFEVKSISHIRNYLNYKGIKIQDETEIPGMERFSFFDPFGNRIEFLEFIS